MLAVVSGRLNLDPGSELFHGGGERTVVVTSEAVRPGSRAALAEVADVLVAGNEQVDLAMALDELTGRGLSRVLCEGGPSLLADLVAAGRLDELCLTFSPQLVGGDGPRVLAGAEVEARFTVGHVLEDSGALLTRYVAR